MQIKETAAMYLLCVVIYSFVTSSLFDFCSLNIMLSHCNGYIGKS